MATKKSVESGRTKTSQDKPKKKSVRVKASASAQKTLAAKKATRPKKTLVATKATAAKKTPAAKKAPAAKKTPAAKKAPVATKALTPELSSVLVSQEERNQEIAVAAYLRAETRGFAHGGEEQDWLAAEQEVNARLSAASTQRA